VVRYIRDSRTPFEERVGLKRLHWVRKGRAGERNVAWSGEPLRATGLRSAPRGSADVGTQMSCMCAGGIHSRHDRFFAVKCSVLFRSGSVGTTKERPVMQQAEYHVSRTRTASKMSQHVGADVVGKSVLVVPMYAPHELSCSGFRTCMRVYRSPSVSPKRLVILLQEA
jgi:hypothetical protein